MPLICVYDDGVGMDIDGLADLWSVGSSNKRTDLIAALRKRRQIGKFGIGKLATYALANRITYLTSSGNDEILAHSLSFDAFKADPAGPERPVQLEVRSISRQEALDIPLIVEAITAAGLNPLEALDPGQSWTLAVLEELKQRAVTLQPGRLRWVLRTAMPLSSGFKVYLNREHISSSKLDYRVVVDFPIVELSSTRMAALNERTGQQWRIETRPAPTHLDSGTSAQKALVCELFDEGIFGRAIVTEKSLYGGKSEDLTRSHGFFVRVLGRLVNEEDPLFGLHPQAHIIFNRLHVEIDADDLDGDLTAPREGVGLSERRTVMADVLLEILREARGRYQKWNEEQVRPQENKREEDRNYVDPRNVEHPIADALLGQDWDADEGNDADEGWFYLRIPDVDEIDNVINKLYSFGSRQPYRYEIDDLGRSGRLVQFVPGERRFILNGSHDLVIAFQDDPRAKDLLYDVVTAEALLEVYLREAGMPAHIVGEILVRQPHFAS